LSNSPEKEPIACRTVAGALFAYASLLDAESQRLNVLDEAATAEEFRDIANRVSARAGYYLSIARRLYDQKGIIRDCEYLVILLREAIPFIQHSSYQPTLGSVFLHQNELLDAIVRHTQDA
jgi:hypothetical protein